MLIGNMSSYQLSKLTVPTHWLSSTHQGGAADRSPWFCFIPGPAARATGWGGGGGDGRQHTGAQLDSQTAAFSAVQQNHLWGLEWEEEETRLLYIKQKRKQG